MPYNCKSIKSIAYVFIITCITCINYSVSYAQRPVNEIEITTHKADTSEQLDILDIGKRLLHIDPSTKRKSTGQKVYFSLLPFSTAVPGGGTALITSTTAGFYMGDRSTTHLSRINFTPYTNFAKRYGLPIRSYVWLKDNEWVIDGDIRFLHYPHNTWGLGLENKNDDNILLKYSYLRIYQHALRKICGGLLMGLGYDLDYRFHIQSESELDLQQITEYPYGTKNNTNSVSSGFSVNVIYDTRANSINTLDGNFANVQFRFNPTILGSDHYWKSLYVELRRYHRLTKDPNVQNMIAVRNFFWTVLGSKAPYLDLPTTGGDPYNSSARGFPLSRFRGKSLYYLETEYRRDLTKNGLLGFVTFINLNSVSGPKSTFLANWNVGAGAGARIKFNKKSATNIAIDYAFSKNHRTVSIGLGEVF